MFSVVFIWYSLLYSISIVTIVHLGFPQQFLINRIFLILIQILLLIKPENSTSFFFKTHFSVHFLFVLHLFFLNFFYIHFSCSHYGALYQFSLLFLRSFFSYALFLLLFFLFLISSLLTPIIHTHSLHPTETSRELANQLRCNGLRSSQGQVLSSCRIIAQGMIS